MSFADILQKIVEGSGAVGAALMGNDGIAIDQVMAEGAAGGSLREDVGAAGVEFGRILDEMRKASAALGGGGVSEAVVSLTRFMLVMRVIDSDSFVVLVMLPDGNLGKARYLIRRHLHALRDEM